MAKGYRPVDRDQQFLMPESMRDWLPASDPVWLVIGVVAGLDTTRLHAQRRTGGAGRAGYDPDMLLTLLVWAWASGVRSSRVIERLCQRDVAYRIICAGDAPDHVTISRFRADTAQVVQDLFTQVLALCARMGMGQLGVVAVDSVKIASNASLAANRTADGLAKAAAEQAQIDVRARALAAAAAAEHAATDAAEDAMYGPSRHGDELPEELVDPRSRAARIAQALEELTADSAARSAERDGIAERQQDREQRQQQRKQAKLDAYRRQRADRGSAPVGKPPTEIRIEVLTENLAAAQARQQAKIDRYLAGGCVGRAPLPLERNAKVNRIKAALDRAIAEAGAREQAQTAAAARAAARRGGEPRRNITDPQSRMMPLRGGGWLQGYNCQAATSSDGLIIATSVGNNPSDAPAFATILDKATAAATLIDAHRRDDSEAPAGIGVVLADAGYLSIDNLTEPGPDRLIAVGKSRDLAVAAREEPTTGPPPPEATPIEAMAHRLRTPEGHALYKQRSHIAETPFAHAKHNLGFRRFTSRGINRAAAEFSFHALVHNLFKAIGTAALAPAAS
ncbi:transposase [Mycobacterium aquaticum]|uniref:Transposase n=1 Tax=Mycobacterium aquaticum TaxID=1927124 RepID=A0A1W9ZTM9_9MYCO|nr:transposase [Mycobacterium aquaticum]